MEFLHTAGAKNNLTKFLKMQQKDQLIRQAIDELNKHLKVLSLPLYHSTADLISKKYSKDEIEKKLFAILDKKENYTQLIKSVYPKEVAAQKKQTAPASKDIIKDSYTSKDTLDVVVDGDMLINYYLCPECKPKP